MSIGGGEPRFEVVEGWGQLPEGWVFKQVAGVAVDSKDRVYALNRGEHPVIVFDREGRFLRSWGEGVFENAHGVFIDKDDHIFCVDNGDHTVRKFTLEGELLYTLGTEGEAAQDNEPFNRPTDAAISPSGDLYISDGYGNTRVHRYSPEGEHILSWGEPGEGPGQFNLPHGVWIDHKDRVYVADRQNYRVQIFTPEGEYLDEWGDLLRPCDVFIDPENRVYIPELEARMSILSLDGEVLARWGEKSEAPGQFIAPHCAWVDSKGDLYVGEVLEGQRLQKFRLTA